MSKLTIIATAKKLATIGYTLDFAASGYDLPTKTMMYAIRNADGQLMRMTATEIKQMHK